MRPLMLAEPGLVAKSGRPVASPKKSHWQDPIAARVALRLGCSVLYAEKRMREAELIARLTVEEMRGAGADKRAERYVEGIERANEQRTPPPDCEGTWSAADAADAREETAQHRYERDRSVKNRAAYIDALREDRRFTTSLIDLMVDEQERAAREQERHS